MLLSNNHISLSLRLLQKWMTKKKKKVNKIRTAKLWHSWRTVTLCIIYNTPCTNSPQTDNKWRACWKHLIRRKDFCKIELSLTPQLSQGIILKYKFHCSKNVQNCGCWLLGKITCPMESASFDILFFWITLPNTHIDLLFKSVSIIQIHKKPCSKCQLQRYIHFIQFGHRCYSGNWFILNSSYSTCFQTSNFAFVGVTRK